MNEATYSEAFIAAVDLCEAVGGDAKGKLWRHEFGEWTVLLNGSREEQEGVSPFQCAVLRHGLPIAMLSPYSGVVIGPWEDAFIEAAKKAAA